MPLVTTPKSHRYQRVMSKFGQMVLYLVEFIRKQKVPRNGGTETFYHVVIVHARAFRSSSKSATLGGGGVTMERSLAAQRSSASRRSSRNSC